ncbi:BatB [Hydrogenimonas sp.]|nr:BatB [Hydrogenimonas sp.]
MRFLYPEFLYLMMIPAALLFYLISTNRDSLERVFKPETVERLRISGDALGRAGHNLLAFTAFFFMTLALAQPVIERGERIVKSKEADIVIALDLSKSMRAADFYPERLSFAKRKLEEILPELPVGRVGVIGFTSAAYIIAPLTEDRNSIRFLLKRVNPRTISAEGTDLSAALEGAEKLLRKSGSKTVLLVTDGGDGKDLGKLRRMIREKGLKLIVWMVATERGAPIVEKGGELLKNRSGKTVISRANTALRELAEESGGVYVRATVSQDDEDRILSYFRSQSSSGEDRERVVRSRIELFYYPLALALLILPFALYSFGGREYAAVTLLVSLPLFFGGQRAEAGIMDFVLIKKAEEAYARKDYNRSAEEFEKLSRSVPRNEVWFDLAASYYKSGRYEEALRTYRKIVTSDKKLNMAKLYSMANCYVKLGDLQKGAELYREVLKMGDDKDARENLELVMKLLHERQKREKRAGRGDEDENRKREKESSAEGKGAEKSGKPGTRKSGSQPREISETEEKKWMRLIKNQPLKSKLYPLVPPGKDENVNRW